MMGSAEDPNALARVIVIPKTKGSNAENQATPPRISSTRAAFFRAGALRDSQGETETLRRAPSTVSYAFVWGRAAVGSDANSPKVGSKRGPTDPLGAVRGRGVFWPRGSWGLPP